MQLSKSQNAMFHLTSHVVTALAITFLLYGSVKAKSNGINLCIPDTASVICLIGP